MAENAVLKKLRWRTGLHGLVVSVTDTYRRLLDDAGAKIEFEGEIEGAYEFIHVFTITKDRLGELGSLLARVATSELILWVSYPKGT